MTKAPSYFGFSFNHTITTFVSQRQANLFTLLAASYQSGATQQAEQTRYQLQANRVTRTEALIWSGIKALEAKNPHDAWLYFCGALKNQPHHPDFPLLLAQAARLQKADAAAMQCINHALKHKPLDSSYRIAAWQAQANNLSVTARKEYLWPQLPTLQDASELKCMLELMPEMPIGAAYLDMSKPLLKGWVFDPGGRDNRLHVYLCIGRQTELVRANEEHPLLYAVTGIRVGGFSIDLSAIQTEIEAHPIHLSMANGTALAGSPFWLDSPLPDLSYTPHFDTVVDVIIPVYQGLRQTLGCIESVLRARPYNKTPHEIIVVNDASPDTALLDALKILSTQGHISLIHHPINLGFIRGMNRAMALHPKRHIVWLNADTLVCHNWLDRLHTTAHSAENIASVTPFSNNGELMSFPQPAQKQNMPDLASLMQLDALASQSWDNTLPELEVGCGFCLYIRRDAFIDTGYLDEHHLLRGYGEDTDWCLRARMRGWQHVGAPHVFVAHAGNVSFGLHKAWLVARNNAWIRRRYPHAEQRYTRYRKRDPIKPHRQRLQHARLSRRTQDQPRVLHCIGSLTWQDPRLGFLTADEPPDTLPHWPQNTCLLSWRQDSVDTQLRLVLTDADSELPIVLDYSLAADYKKLRTTLSQLAIKHLVLYHLHHCSEMLLALLQNLDVPYHLHPLDDSLLIASPATLANHQIRQFAQTAQAIELPFKTLFSTYEKHYPGVSLIHTPYASLVNAKLPSAAEAGNFLAHAKTILIADHLNHACIAKRWLKLAHHFTQCGAKQKFILLQQTPHAQMLQASGCVYTPSLATGLNTSEMLQLAGCRVAVSLDATPSSGWMAPALANRYTLPLFAAHSKVASEIGVYSL
ncbi:glycosyltransferase family 2 protein [Thiorhodospira sibirica]|uniref:glycosyltransferase family 2 protein n=1 Tax=Thiorhodospira sibirica TaxID=154347 RepID=UPI00022C0B54|nr:glycosyltransferase family 2 protein [Thiorhodospira sibirica]